MSNLNKFFLCLEKNKSKSLGQKPDDLKHFLMKDFSYDSERSMKLIDEAIVANIVKSVIFEATQMIRLSYQERRNIIFILFGMIY